MANRKAYKHGVGYSTEPRGKGGHADDPEGRLAMALGALGRSVNTNRAPIPRKTGRGS